jgi:class 3 adenylate cyclase
VIGPAVNFAAGLEGSCCELGVDLVLSDAFARPCAAAEYRRLGQYRLPGIGRPIEPSFEGA